MTTANFYAISHNLLIVLSVCVFAVPWVLILLPFVFLLVFKLFRYSISAFREVTRIESVSKSPILSFVIETLSGASTIRAFKKQSEF